MSCECRQLSLRTVGACLTTALLLAGLLEGVSTADDEGGWPFIRGANFDGHATNEELVDAWPAAGPPVLWTRELGQGYSSFAAWDDRVATQMQSLAGQFVVCLEADTGKTIWEHRYDWPHEPAGVYPGPRATPTYTNGQLYFAAPNGLIGCLRAEDGREIWSFNVKEAFGGDGTDFGYSCAPTVVDDLVLLPVGGANAAMVALDAADGSVRWRTGNDAASYTPAYPISFQGRRCVIGYLQNTLALYDLKSGEEIWRHELSAGYDEHSAWPIYSEPHLWISSPFRAGSELLEFTGDSSRPVRTVWKSQLLSNDIFSSVLVDGALYGFDLEEAQSKTHRPSRGRFRCLDFLTGQQYWATGDSKLRRSTDARETDVGKRVGHATVIVADGKLIMLNDTGELILARATTERYAELARISVLGGEICWTQPTLHRGRLFVRNHSRAACVYLGDPSALETPLRESAITAEQIPQSEYFDVAAVIMGVEPEYAFDLPSAKWLRDWFLISLIGILGVSAAVTVLTRAALGRRLGLSGSRWLFWSVAFLLGCLGTTFISQWRDDFVFTWPVAIFVAFQAAVTELRLTNRSMPRTYSSWRSVLAAALFIVASLVYFLLCRRLSLVFEWAFLCGFPAALPFAMLGVFCFRGRTWRPAWEVLMTAMAFVAFYWSAVAVLLLRG